MSLSVRYGVLALVAALALGLLWSGVTRFQAEQRSIRFASAAGASLGGEPSAVPAVRAPEVPSKTVSLPADPPSGAAKQVEEQPEPLPLFVHVAGAVAAPGVYRLVPDARVADAILAAGGSLPEGVPDALNLASPVADGDKVYVFTEAELAPALTASPAAQGATHTPVAVVAGSGTTAGGGSGVSSAGKVNINTASVGELQRIKGVGPATAEAIVAYRAEQGPFARVEDLVKVKGIGSATLEKLRPHVTL